MNRTGILVCALLAGAAGCKSESDGCATHEDCPTGHCNVLGRCAAAPSDQDAALGSMDATRGPVDVGPQADTGVFDAGPQDVGTADTGPEDSGPEDSGPEDSGPEDSGPMDAGMGCVPNGDGQIDQMEVPLAAGGLAPFLVASTAQVDLAGTITGNGRRWDFSQPVPSDRQVTYELLGLPGHWFGPLYPQGHHASLIPGVSGVLGIYGLGADQVTLMGVASSSDGPLRTELSYDDPVTMLQFPLSTGNNWDSQSTVRGLAGGVASLYNESYSAQVDGAGFLNLSFGTIEVLRVRTEMTRTVGLLVTTVRTFSFVSECFGTVAWVVSEPDESEVEFTTAAEFWRRAP